MNQKQLESEIRALLDQFGQVILHGPPGTGKTYAARRVAASLLGADDAGLDNNDRFALVQFHPSYNYEDFVRGVQVKTDDGQVVYETVNRVFGQMAEKAASASDKAFAMVIDEINRANVSAVLGELIYALEYRGKPVKTPYAIGSGKNAADITVPANLKIIGTMNAADRTIGQIDYAVRRRFAFVHCAPDVGIVQSVGGPRATEFFKLVNDVFAHLSPDYDAEDVRIGHSYFLADGGKLARNVIYQVIPILREYLKDGVLKKDAEVTVGQIKEQAEKLLEAVAEHEKNMQRQGEWSWKHIPSGAQEKGMNLRRLVLSLVKHHAANKPCGSLNELREDFPDKIRRSYGVVQDPKSKKVLAYQKKEVKYFLDDPIIFADGSEAVVCTQWGARASKNDPLNKDFDNFKKQAREFGYEIYRDGDAEVWTLEDPVSHSSVRLKKGDELDSWFILAGSVVREYEQRGKSHSRQNRTRGILKDEKILVPSDDEHLLLFERDAGPYSFHDTAEIIRGNRLARGSVLKMRRMMTRESPERSND